jgi:hypothetical protein
MSTDTIIVLIYHRHKLLYMLFTRFLFVCLLGWDSKSSCQSLEVSYSKHAVCLH